MPVFEYKGLDGVGKAVGGLLEADSAKVARSRLRKQGVFPTEVREQVQGATRGAGLNVEIDVSKYLQFITTTDISQLTQQLATMIGASIPMVEALAALVDQAEKSRLKVILSQVKEKVNEGAPLADALADHPKIFDTLYVQMVRAGEKSGALDEVLERLAKYTDSQVKMQGKVVSALIYPVMMMCVGALILLGLFVGVIPRVRGLFASLGGEAGLPLLTKAMFFVGDLMVGNPPSLLGFFARVAIFGTIGVIVGYIFRRWVATEEGRRRFDRFKLRMPIFGRVNRIVAVSRFCRTLGTLLVSGVPILSALEIAQNVVGNAVIADAIKAAAHNIQEGQSIALPLRASGEFPPVVTHMIAVGERTGDLEKMLNTVADAYDHQAEVTLEAVTSLLGPMAIIGLGGAVFLTAIGLLLPLANISKMIHN
jgi:general secretion pathway protein F